MQNRALGIAPVKIKRAILHFQFLFRKYFETLFKTDAHSAYFFQNRVCKIRVCLSYIYPVFCTNSGRQGFLIPFEAMNQLLFDLFDSASIFNPVWSNKSIFFSKNLLCQTVYSSTSYNHCLYLCFLFCVCMFRKNVVDKNWILHTRILPGVCKNIYK